MSLDPRLDTAIRLIESARAYSLSLIDDIDDADWFVMPAGCPTHVAWQAGHLAMAEYALTLVRIRGKEPTDAAFIDNAFVRTFKKGSSPAPSAHLYPAPAEIRVRLHAVHTQALAEMPHYAQKLLDEPLPEPHFGYATKLGSLYFCAAHEMLHAGQIGVLRRLLGKPPVR